ncbi:hypothetical protein DY000_02053779 [Brassica cretica]|uniref:Secreted protein n=1 Tax=Brassica cretica TaxID=69181 RepID=A0ABQ7AEJ3_BRACR|nr:hypothetical protein DY000_02053779 [Brassica cretica]
MGDFRFSLSTATSPPIGDSLVSVSLSVALGFSLSRWLSSATSLSVSLSTLLWFLSLDGYFSFHRWISGFSLSLSVALPSTATELPLGVSPRSTTARDGQLSRWLSSDRKLCQPVSSASPFFPQRSLASLTLKLVWPVRPSTACTD